MDQDNVALVTPQDEVIGQLNKLIAHRYPAQLHRAISVWMVDEDGRLLFQKRSNKKIVGAGWWGNTVCGNVWPGESYEDCAQRRLNFELGISEADVLQLKLDPLLKFHYKAYANETYGEHEIDQVFVCRVNASDVKLNLNPDEVSEIEWVKSDEFFAEIDRCLLEFTRQQGRQYPTAEQTVAMTFDELKRWTKPVDLEFEGEVRTFVPWTILMAQMSELRKALSYS